MELTDTAFGHQTGFAFVTVYLINILKDSKWFPWLNTEADKINRMVSVVVALLTAAGVKIAMDGNIWSGGVLTIHFPSAWDLVDTLMHFATQFGLQEMIYQ